MTPRTELVPSGLVERVEERDDLHDVEFDHFYKLAVLSHTKHRI